MKRPAPKLVVLAMDIGTSSTRTALFDERGQRIDPTAASETYSVRYRDDGGAELNPETLRRAARICLRKTLAARTRSRILKKIPLAAISGSGFWHSLLGLDRDGRVITPIFTWADSRCTKDAARLRAHFHEREIHARTGSMLRSTFWPAKLLWLKRTQPKIFSRVAQWTSPADWIFRELLGVCGTSASMASATGLYNLHTRNWDKELCKFCGVDSSQLAKISQDADGARGELRSTKVFFPVGDGAAGNLGSSADRGNRVAINIGTSAAVRMIQPGDLGLVPFGLFRFVVDETRDVIGGAVSNAGNLRKWCLRELKIDEKAEAKNLARTRSTADELDVLPFWVNERAPTWPENVRGVIAGLTQASDAAEILRAITTSTYYRLAQILELIESRAGRASQIIVSGGVLHSRASLNLLADALGRDLTICPELEASLRGAAIFALEELGQTPTDLRRGKIVRHNAALAAKHRARRQRQIDLEGRFFNAR